MPRNIREVLTHIYYIEDVDALPHLTEFIFNELEKDVGKQEQMLIPASQLFNKRSRTIRFYIWTMLETGIMSELDIVLQLGLMVGNSGIHTKKGDYYMRITSVWENHELQKEYIVSETTCSPTDDWFPILVGMFSPIISAGINSALRRSGL